MKKLIFILAFFFQISFLFSVQYDGKIEIINDRASPDFSPGKQFCFPFHEFLFLINFTGLILKK